LRDRFALQLTHPAVSLADDRPELLLFDLPDRAGTGVAKLVVAGDVPAAVLRDLVRDLLVDLGRRRRAGRAGRAGSTAYDGG
jgi:hypothetical protein